MRARIRGLVPLCLGIYMAAGLGQTPTVPAAPGALPPAAATGDAIAQPPPTDSQDPMARKPPASVSDPIAKPAAVVPPAETVAPEHKPKRSRKPPDRDTFDAPAAPTTPNGASPK